MLRLRDSPVDVLGFKVGSSGFRHVSLGDLGFGA